MPIKSNKKINSSNLSKKDIDKYRVGKTLPINSSNNSEYQKKSKKNLSTKNKKINKKNKINKKKLFLVVVVLLILAAGVFGFFAWDKIKDIFKGSLFDLIAKNEPLEVDKYGRSNFLIFGTSEDDEGHSGASLADSIMIVSINQNTFEGNILNLPRDLWVKLDNKCPSYGKEQKLNTVYACALQEYKGDEHKASQAFADKSSSILGTDIQYYAKINYTVVREIVNSLGGIDVEISSDDSRGIFDPATKIKFTNGIHHIDGNTALELTRSRGAFGGYGFSRSNYDRERNQQAVARAILNKSTSSGVLANPAKVLSIFGSLGENIISNVETKNVKTVISIASNTSDDKIKTLTLNDKDNPFVIGGSHRGLSIVKPKAGLFTYHKIHEYIADNFTDKTAQASQ